MASGQAAVSYSDGGGNRAAIWEADGTTVELGIGGVYGISNRNPATGQLYVAGDGPDGFAGIWLVSYPAPSPTDFLGDLRESVVAQVGLNSGGLTAKIDAVAASIDEGHLNAACNQLSAFVNQVDALMRSHKLPAETGLDWIDRAESIRTALGCD